MGSTADRNDEVFVPCRDLDQRIAEMRELLAMMRPTSTAGALRVLRDSFPDIPLDQRVRAISEARG